MNAFCASENFEDFIGLNSSRPWGRLTEKLQFQMIQFSGRTSNHCFHSILNPVSRRLQPMPGVGPMTAAAFNVFAPPAEILRSGRDLVVWVGLVPRQHSTGGKARLGRVSKIGQQDIRRLSIIGAIAVVRWAVRKPLHPESWLVMMLPREPKMLVAIARANKMARGIWAMMRREEEYRFSAAG